MSSIMEVRGVSYIYSAGTPFEVRALDNIDISIRSGAITGIIGHTGSGKSTLVKLLNGLERPTDGKVLIEGKDIWENPKGTDKLCFKVGLVMQYPEYQLFEETVYDDVAFGPRNMGLDEKEIDTRIKSACRLVGLSDEEIEKSPFELSGGQKRRAAIAGVMAMQPEILILDEPAAGLDPEGRKVIFDAVDEYRNQRGATVIIVSHSMEDMARRCDDMIVMANGTIAASGSKDDVFSDVDKLLEAGLDVPQITKLSMLLKEKGCKEICGPVYTVEQAAKMLLPLITEKKGN